MNSTPTTPKNRRTLSVSSLSLNIPTESQPSSPLSPSPVARRRAQYKSRTPRGSLFASAENTPGGSSTSRYSKGIDVGADAFMRERFKRRCFERAKAARDDAVRARRGSVHMSSDPSSDGFEDAMDYEDEREEETDEDVMQDELFRRIMSNMNRKERHGYRLSYADEVGSSFDPDMEDVERWENELRELPPSTSSQRTQMQTSEHEDVPDGLEFDDLNAVDPAELAAYAEEYAARAEFADFEYDLPPDVFELTEEDAEALGVRRDKGKGRAFELAPVVESIGVGRPLETEDVEMDG